MTDAKQEKWQNNAQTQKVLESVSYLLLKVDIKDKDLFLKVKQKKKKHCITYDKVNGKDSNEHFETEDTKGEVNV